MSTSTLAKPSVVDVLSEADTAVATTGQLIGIALDSSGFLFLYQGEDSSPKCLLNPDGSPKTRLENFLVKDVTVVTVEGAVRTQVKLNVTLEKQGALCTLTTGVQSMPAQCLVTGLMGAQEQNLLDTPLTFEFWKGRSATMCNVKTNPFDRNRLTSDNTYERLAAARAAKSVEEEMQMMIGLLHEEFHELKQNVVTVEPIESDQDNSDTGER